MKPKITDMLIEAYQDFDDVYGEITVLLYQRADNTLYEMIFSDYGDRAYEVSSDELVRVHNGKYES